MLKSDIIQFILHKTDNNFLRNFIKNFFLIFKKFFPLNRREEAEKSLAWLRGSLSLFFSSFLTII